MEPQWQEYHTSSHILTSELAKIANETQSGLLVLTHILYHGTERNGED